MINYDDVFNQLGFEMGFLSTGGHALATLLEIRGHGCVYSINSTR